MGREKILDKAKEKSLTAALKKLGTSKKSIPDIAKEIGISVSSLQKFKKKLQDQGVPIPNVRGRWLRSEREPGSAASSVKAVTGNYPASSSKNKENVPVPSHAGKYPGQKLEIFINDIPLQIFSTPENVIISDKQIEVSYGKTSVKITF